MAKKELVIPRLDWALASQSGDAVFCTFNEAVKSDPFEVKRAIGQLSCDMAPDANEKVASPGKRPTGDKKQYPTYITGAEHTVDEVLKHAADGRRFAFGDDVRAGVKTDLDRIWTETDRVVGTMWNDEAYAAAREAAHGTELGSRESRTRGLMILEMVIDHNAAAFGIEMPHSSELVAASEAAQLPVALEANANMEALAAA